MTQALELAKKGAGAVHPNPLVGALIVRDGTVIGRGHHAFAGGPHAETEAIADAHAHGHSDLTNALLYVNLEPCCHHGKTPPCTGAIIASGIQTVVAGMTDPNPLVAGKGINALASAGISVITGILEAECREVNRIFIKFISFRKPFVLLKSALSLDGKIASVTGESKWISCEASRADVHCLRSEYTAVMCGINTILADNPSLDVRLAGGRNPSRIILDSNLRIPLDSVIVQSAGEIPTIVACAETPSGGQGDHLSSKRKDLEDAGITVIQVREKNGRLNLKELMAKLGERGIDSILLEAGSTLAFSALKEGIVDKVRFYIAPLIIGGCQAASAVGGAGFPSLASACRIANLRSFPSGTDLCVEGDICLPE